MNRFIRQFSFYWAPLLIWMGVIFWGTSLSADSVERLSAVVRVPFTLDVAHIIEFAILAALAYRAFRTWKGFRSRLALWGAVVGFAVLYGISDEAHQWLVPGRWPSRADLVLDAAGALAGLALADGLVRGSSAVGAVYRGWAGGDKGVNPLIARLLPASDQRAARQTLWIGAITTVQLLASVVQVAFSARILGPEGLGVLAIIIASTSLLYRFVSLPGNEVITTFVTRSVAEGRMEEATGTLRFTFVLSQALSLLSYALLAVGALVVSGLIGGADAYKSSLLVYGVGGIAAATVRESMALLRLADQLRLGFAVAVVGAAARVSLLLAAWLTGGGLMMVVLAYVAGDVITGVGMFIAASASERKAGLPGFLRSLSAKVPSRDVIAFQVGSFWRASVEAVILHIDVILIANIVSLSQVGIYRAAHQIVDATKHPFRSISTGVQAEYSRQWYGGEMAAVRRISRHFGLLSLAIAVAGYGLLAIIHGPIIRIMLGPGFEEAAFPLLFLLPGALAFAVIAPFYVLPAATGRAIPHLASSLAMLATMVTALLILAPRYGAEGAAWANSIGWIVFAAVFVPFIVGTLRRGKRRRPVEA